jgi:hypothetical protein
MFILDKNIRSEKTSLKWEKFHEKREENTEISLGMARGRCG